MQYIYVLTSSVNDSYYEQFLLSITSLRLYNPDANIIAVIDQNTKNTLTTKRCEYEKIVSEIKIIQVPEKLNQKEVSRWIKTSLREYIDGDYLFIDTDTIITEKLTFDSLEGIQLGAVLDTHTVLSGHHLADEFRKRDLILGFKAAIKTNTHYNSGIIYCKNTKETHAFYEKWHKLWIESNQKGISSDQSAFNQADYELGSIITALGGKWNCQISHNGLPYLHDSKIIHYYATSLTSFVPAYKLASDTILSSIKESGIISLQIMELLKNPKSAFEPYSRIVADPVVIEAFDSSLFSKLIWLNRRHSLIFKKLNKFTAFLTKGVKKVIKKS